MDKFEKIAKWSSLFCSLGIFIAGLCFFLISERHVVKEVPPKPKPVMREKHDYGHPVHLTPMIEDGQLEKARNLSSVTEYFDWVDSYAGYLTVRKDFNSNLFFWYFPAETSDERAPVILWLHGEIGVSSLVGTFCENGPFYLAPKQTLRRRKHSWTTNHHMIFIDSPVGTGYSYTEDEGGYPTNTKDVVRDLHGAIEQLFTLFAELQSREFYIMGEYLSGKYVATLGYKIVQNIRKYKKREKNPPVSIKFAGVAIGSGFIDPLHQIVFSEFLHGVGLIGSVERQEIHDKEKLTILSIKKHYMEHAFKNYTELLDMITEFTGNLSLFNYLHGTEPICRNEVIRFIHSPEVRKALHVGYLELETDPSKKNSLEGDYMQSAATMLPLLLHEYPVLIYSGQLDAMVPYSSTLKYLQRLKFDSSDIFKLTRRSIWNVDNEFAGYLKKGGNLYETLFINAGHVVTDDQPKFALQLITNFTHKRGFFGN